MMRRRTIGMLAACAVVSTTVGPAVLAASLRATLPAAGVADVAEQVARRIFPALRASDVLAEAGQEARLEAAIGTGVKRDGLQGKRIRFLLGETVLGEAQTDSAGKAVFAWKTPAEPADHRVLARLHPDDQTKEPLADAEILVAARPRDASLVIVDLDKTVVASGFFSVLAGMARPMPGAAVVLGRLAKEHTIVYLTHRPDFLAASSKRWLAENGFPAGPVLTSTMSTLLSGSGSYKSARLAAIKKTFSRIPFGIGDKMSDVAVYAEHGLKPILILEPDWSGDDPEDYEKLAADLVALPDAVQVVTNWQQVGAICFEKGAFPKTDMIKRLRDAAAELRRRGKG